MSTFIVRFIGEATESCRGIVKHVSTGEELTFTSFDELKKFMEGMTIVKGIGAAESDSLSDQSIEAGLSADEL